MTNSAADDELKALTERIKELNEKGTQLLLFFSFAIVGAATVNTHDIDAVLVRSAMAWWVLAAFPVLVSVIPVKELASHDPPGYRRIVKGKSWLLRVAIGFSLVGAIQFVRAVSQGGLLVTLLPRIFC